jgi:hypothetical protein
MSFMPWMLLAEKNSAPVPCAISLKIPALNSPALPMPMVYTFILLLFARFIATSSGTLLALSIPSVNKMAIFSLE